MEDRLQIKLYPTRELLRESADLRMPWLFNGWNDKDESIRMWAYRNVEDLTGLIAHEAVLLRVLRRSVFHRGGVR